MTPKIISSMKEEKARLDRQLSGLAEKIVHLQDEMTKVRTNRDAIATFLGNYGSEDIVVAKPNGHEKHSNKRYEYGPTAETMEFLKAVYPNWASTLQIRENLKQSGMVMAGDLITRLFNGGKIERMDNPEKQGYLYRLKVEYMNQDDPVKN